MFGLREIRSDANANFVCIAVTLLARIAQKVANFALEAGAQFKMGKTILAGIIY